MEVMEHASERCLTQGTHGPKIDHHQMLPRLQSRVEVHFSTGMPYKGLQVKLDTDPVTRCNKAHLEVTLKQVNGAMFNMPPLIVSSLRDAREHEATQLLLNSCLNQYTAVEPIRLRCTCWYVSGRKSYQANICILTTWARKSRQRMESSSRFFWTEGAQVGDMVH